jgi:nitrite reductase/ring-hydroxylating ferredoxin subunit
VSHDNQPTPIKRRQALQAIAAIGAGSIVLSACRPAIRLDDLPIEGQKIANVGAFPLLGSSMSFKIGDGSGYLLRIDLPIAGGVSIGNVHLVARSSVCTHLGCEVSIESNSANCPCHGSRFNATTGAVTNGPAIVPLLQIPLAARGDDIYAVKKT